MINHKQILGRLKSFKTLYELTKAIQLVALSKLRAIKKKEKNRYLVPFGKIFSTSNKLRTNTLYIPVTTDRSCCGSINNIIIDRLKHGVQISGSKEFHIFLLGKKGKSLTKKLYSSEYIYNAINLTKYQLSIMTMCLLVEKLHEVEEKVNTNYNNYVIFYNYFKNIVTQLPSMISMVSYKAFTREIGDRLAEFTYLNNTLDEEKDNYFMRDLYDFSMSIVLMKSLYENEISEYGARASAMRNASKNAEDVIKKLQLQYNKARQAHITNELIEIISCVNSIVSSDNIEKYSFYLQYLKND